MTADGADRDMLRFLELRTFGLALGVKARSEFR